MLTRLFILFTLIPITAVSGFSHPDTSVSENPMLHDGDIVALRQMFNQNDGKTRLILLLSPT